jgi:hypothetical protein
MGIWKEREDKSRYRSGSSDCSDEGIWQLNVATDLITGRKLFVVIN